MILGQDRAVARFREAMDSGSLHHGWLLAGPRGVGKASFAREAATRLLANAAGPSVTLPGIGTPGDHPVARYIAAGSHPDFRWVERELNVKTDTLKRNISVDQVRKLGDFFANTTSLSPWRAVVIDSVDDLERGRQCVAQDARGAAGKHAVPARQPCPGTAAPDHPVALPTAGFPDT